jgi:probable FeS assembly SUF system protein SufT
MTPPELIALRRDCEATTVPFGEAVLLSEGGLVRIVQRRGASITVETELGLLLRIEGGDADALGLDPASTPTHDDAGEFHLDQVMAALDTLYDPEIPISIVELGLIYRCDAVSLPDGTRRVEIDMTMTAPGCGMGDIIRDDAIRTVSALPGVDEVTVNVVWEPPWTMARISESARLQLGLL